MFGVSLVIQIDENAAPHGSLARCESSFSSRLPVPLSACLPPCVARSSEILGRELWKKCVNPKQNFSSQYLQSSGIFPQIVESFAAVVKFPMSNIRMSSFPSAGNDRAGVIFLSRIRTLLLEIR